MPEGSFEKAVYEMQNLAPYDDVFEISASDLSDALEVVIKAHDADVNLLQKKIAELEKADPQKAPALEDDSCAYRVYGSCNRDGAHIVAMEMAVKRMKVKIREMKDDAEQ